VYDIFGQYNIAFFIAGGLSTLGACVAFLVPILLVKHKNTNSKHSNAIECKIEKLYPGVHNERDTKGPLTPLYSDTIKPEHVSQCVYCSDLISLSGCPRNCIENTHPVKWV